ncbi:hypothetical protein TURU_043822 [Turdus rufiventris]|nr:hypothetical protein TURU_043822 [Turdus rufiventris]
MHTEPGESHQCNPRAKLGQGIGVPGSAGTQPESPAPEAPLLQTGSGSGSGLKESGMDKSLSQEARGSSTAVTGDSSAQCYWDEESQNGKDSKLKGRIWKATQILLESVDVVFKCPSLSWILSGKHKNPWEGYDRATNWLFWEVFTWRREGSRETLEFLLMPKGAPGDLERDFGQGHGVPG